MPFTESELLPVSALQHLLFCERQCALIHLEQQWAENRLTALGRIEHERVDEGYREFRRGRRQVSGLHVRSLRLGLYGRLDVLELDLIDRQGPDNALAFGLKGKWCFYPVEFKHGTSKEGDCDRVQLCAQALCLEEMLNVGIAEASLFYHRIRRREEVVLDARLREATFEAAARLQQLFARGVTRPIAVPVQCWSCAIQSGWTRNGFITTGIASFNRSMNREAYSQYPLYYAAQEFPFQVGKYHPGGTGW